MKQLLRRLKANDGFTYLDVIVAFILFGMMFVFVVRISNSIYDLNRVSQLESRMIHIAELEFENYKSGINDVNGFLAITGFVITDEQLDGENHLITRSLELSQLDGRFEIVIDELRMSPNVSQIAVEVRDTQSDANSARLIGQMIVDTP